MGARQDVRRRPYIRAGRARPTKNLRLEEIDFSREK